MLHFTKLTSPTLWKVVCSAQLLGSARRTLISYYDINKQVGDICLVKFK